MYNGGSESKKFIKGVTKMATNMRCPGCGSTRVIFESHKEGYDFKKGVAGAVLFGAVGAVAGVNGKKTSSYHCAACGQTFSRLMSESVANQITMAIKSNNYTALACYKRDYPNIEWEESRNVQSRIVQNRIVQSAPAKAEVEKLIMSVVGYYPKDEASILEGIDRRLKYDNARLLHLRKYKIDTYMRADYCEAMGSLCRKRKILCIPKENHEQTSRVYSKYELLNELTEPFDEGKISEYKYFIDFSSNAQSILDEIRRNGGECNEGDLKKKFYALLGYENYGAYMETKDTLEHRGSIVHIIDRDIGDFYCTPDRAKQIKEEEEIKRQEAEIKRKEEEKRAVEQRKRNEQRKKEIDAEMNECRKQIEEQESVIEAHKFGLFGNGARIKADARQKIAEIEEQVNKLRSERMGIISELLQE